MRLHLRSILFLFVFGLGSNVSAQTFDFKKAEEHIIALSTLILTDQDETARVQACDSIKVLLQSTLSAPGSFEYPFSDIQTMSVLKDSSGKFRIFTGQLFVNDSTYQYYGGIQKPGEPNPLYLPLTDAAKKIDDINYDILDAEEWPGALYYKMLPFKGADGDCWILFGYNGFSFFNKRKYLEVLHFEGDRPVFGGPYFEKRDGLGVPVVTNRVVLTYSSDASVSLNFDPIEGMIVFDNLMESTGIYPGQGTASVPDGTYSGYKYDHGKWVFQEQLSVEAVDEPIRAVPDDGTKRTGLFDPSIPSAPKKKRKKN